MKTFDNAILRIQADVSSFDNPIDILHDDIPQYWRGNDLLVQLGVISGDDVVDVSDLASITLDIRALNNDGEAPTADIGALMSQKCENLDQTVDLESWKNGGKQHAEFRFSGEESNLKPGSYWLSIWASTEEGKTLTLGAGVIRVLEDGGGISTTPPEPIEKYYTADDVDNKFVALSRVATDPALGTSDDKVPSQFAVKQYVDSTSGRGEANTASNTGRGRGVFKEKVGEDLVFKSLSAGSNVSIIATDDELVISSSGGGGGGGGSGGHTIQHDGESFPTRDNLNFVGAIQVTDSDFSTDISVDTSQFLQAGNNLSEITNKSEALQNLGGISEDATVNGKKLMDNPVLSADDIAEGEVNKYNVQPDWLATSGPAEVLNKPTLGQVAVEDVLPINKGGTGATTAQSACDAIGALKNTSTVNGKSLASNPTLSSDDIAEGGVNKYNVQSDWAATSGASAILNKPSLADVAISGQYSDLAGRPTIGTLGQQSAGNVSITGGKITGITDLAVADGGTGASTASGARTNLGLGSVAVENVVPVNKGGTGLSGIGAAGQVLSVNSSASGLEWKTASSGSGMTNPMTTRGDVIVGGTSGTPGRLGIGSAGQVLSVNSSANGLVWTTISSGGGGSGMINPMTELGDTIAGGANGVPVRVPVPTTGKKWYLLQCFFDNGLPNVRWNPACAVQSWWADNKNNFYRKYADGWIIQGGMVDAGVKEVTLYITMVYDDYFVISNTIGASTDTTVKESQICPISTRYNKFTFSATTTTKRRWLVCGI